MVGHLASGDRGDDDGSVGEQHRDDEADRDRVDTRVVAVAIEGGRRNNPHQRGYERPRVAAQHAHGRQARQALHAHGAARDVVPRGVGHEDTQAQADQGVTDCRGVERDGQAHHERGALGGDAPLGGARREGEASELDALADDRDDQERQPPRHRARSFEASPPQEDASQANERAHQLDEDCVGGLPARPHVAVDGRQQGHAEGDEEAGHHPLGRESGQVGGQEAGDREVREHLAHPLVQGDDDRADSAGPGEQGSGVRPYAPPVRLQGDRALEADRGSQEPVDHEESVHGPQARRGHGCQGPEAHEGCVKAREECNAREEQEREAADGQLGDGRPRRHYRRGLGWRIRSRGTRGWAGCLAHVGSWSWWALPVFPSGDSAKVAALLAIF